MTEELPVNLPDATPRRLLVTWANQQDGWIRLLTAETILARQEVSEDTLDKIYAQFLAEKRLSDRSAAEIPNLELDTTESVAEESLELKSITKVQGVNALAADQALDVDPSLTHRLQDRIASEVEQLRPGSNTLLPIFAKGTAVYTVVESLGPTTELAELNELANVPSDGEQTQARLQEEVSALRGNTLDAVLANAQQTERELKRLRDVLAILERFDVAAYQRAQESLESAQARRRQAREQLFSESELPGPPDEDWQRFIVAADSYRLHLGREHYPRDNDACLYCMQPLGAGALDLVRRYRTFLDETLVQQVATAQRNLDEVRLAIEPGELHQATEYTTAQATIDKPPAWTAAVSALLADAQMVVDETAARLPTTKSELAALARPQATVITQLHKSAHDNVTKVASDKANAATLLSEKQQQLAELTARIELKRNLATARNYVQRAKRAQRLEQLSRDVSNRPAKSLTVQSKLASEDLVNKNFEHLFTDECARLRAPKVALIFQGRSGKAERKKVVAHYKPSAVLSEGEQKVLAIADFLAESRMRGTKAPLVFDDPVTSLDYRRLDEVAGRIQELSITHQVIVLTHNIMFASALISVRQNKRLRVKIYEVRDAGATKGVLAPDVEPQLDTAAELAKRINAKLQHIPKAEPILQDALIKETYDLLRAWCEAFVEQELLQNVTQRYRANIMMTRLSKIDSKRFDAAVAVITPLFERACDRMTGHSHAAEYLSTKPTLAELETDWNKARAARDAYIAK